VKFSIVTPSFNQGRFIRDCIESVQGQAGVEWEHIIQDAGSTDGTLAVLQEFPHLHVTCEPDQGMSDGINRGFRKAIGDWVMWLNTDDYLLPGALAQVRDFVTAKPQADIIYGDCLFVDENKQLIRRRHEHGFDFNEFLFYGCYIPSTATFIRRQVITAGHLVDTDYKVCMDFEYYARLARLGYRFEFLDAALAGFRWHGINTSTVLGERRRAERLRVQQKYLTEMGRRWLAQPWLIAALFRAYQVKRALRRALSRAP
jgi:glycosyltransferase involved in cell wall biosynthesis